MRRRYNETEPAAEKYHGVLLVPKAFWNEEYIDRLKRIRYSSLRAARRTAPPSEAISDDGQYADQIASFSGTLCRFPSQ